MTCILDLGLFSIYPRFIGGCDPITSVWSQILVMQRSFWLPSKKWFARRHREGREPGQVFTQLKTCSRELSHNALLPCAASLGTSLGFPKMELSASQVLSIPRQTVWETELTFFVENYYLFLISQSSRPRGCCVVSFGGVSVFLALAWPWLFIMHVLYCKCGTNEAEISN